MLLEADSRDAQKQRLSAMEDSVSTELRRDPAIDIGDISTAGGRLSFLVRNPTQVDAAVEKMRTLTRPVALTGNRDWDVQVVDSTRVVLIPTASGTATALKDAMGVARDVVRRRIDPGGTKEITVITEGNNRILVQVPGVEDPDALKKLIGQTARLEFKLVDLSANPQDLQQGRAPPGSQVLPMADGTGSMAVKRRVMVSGDQLTDAQQGFDQDGRAVINIKFNTARRAPVRPRDPGECRQAVRDHPRRQGSVGAQHQRADPRRPGANQRQFHGPERPRPRGQPGVGQVAGEAERDRGAHRRPRPRQGFDPQGRDRQPRRNARRGRSSCW